MAELAMRFGLAPAQIGAWKKQSSENAAGVLEWTSTASSDMPGGHEPEKRPICTSVYPTLGTDH